MLSDAEQAASDRAVALLAATELLAEDNLPASSLARRSRAVADDLLRALAALDDERGARLRAEADRDRWRDQRWQEIFGEAYPT